MFDGYHFGSLKYMYYDEMMSTLRIGVVEGKGLSNELKNWTKSPIWILLVAAGVFGMRWDVKWDAKRDARWDMWPTTHIISRVCGELYLKSSIHVWAETFASVVCSI